MKNDPTINKIISLIFTTSRLIRERSKGKEHPDPFSFLQIETLRYVSENKNPPMKDVADYLYITPPSATSLIDGLVKTKMLERNFDKNDRRVVRLSVTSKGQKILSTGFNETAIRMQKILKKLDEKEQKNLIEILEKLSRLYAQ